ncbi:MULTISPECIES: histidine kinase [Methylorubrum]|uniref:Histidine kinase n=2 Tax=Methylorubrum TaxID=2282523 RepID=A0ABQ4UA73_9HYPH|nr:MULTISPECIES: histidine kinase [Methylobacteriaceae]AWI89307.1 histidine kinase [Methylobacterium sp. DM1]MDV2986084.1 histidine kinase [Methylobacteriaceae bacterium AG10]HEV2545456.1 histidine kinase [Methylobacterium sp.]QIJ77689.1 histidine kinase [Methylobacterium sp. CLZ]QIJ82589.1 histidine kinase [Methylobacterium sp. NI91]
MPTLFRFLATIAILAGLVFAGMFALATFVQPTPREMSVTIPPAKLQPGNR